MNTQRWLVGLTMLNFGLLVYQLGHSRPVEAQGTAPVLRGRALEIVDDRGKLRAAIKIEPADRNVKMPDGGTMPETVILRLIDPNGKPSVKITTSDRSSELGLGALPPTYVLLQAHGEESSLKLTNKDGHQTLVKP